MFDRFRTGWELTKASARALDADRELLVFPFVAALASLLVIATFVVPIGATELWRSAGDDTTKRVLGAVVAWLFYFAMSTVTIYFNTALVGAALVRLEGGDPTLRDGLRVANSRIPTILGYAAISATVGLLLKIAQRRSGLLQRWVISLVGIAWSVATFLVVPVLAATGTGPVEAIKQSAGMFRRTWGEQLAGMGGIKLISGLIMFGLVLLGVPSVVLTASQFGAVPAITVGGLFVLAMVLVGLVSAALQGVFTAALYRYATTGQTAFGFERALPPAFANAAPIAP